MEQEGRHNSGWVEGNFVGGRRSYSRIRLQKAVPISLDVCPSSDEPEAGGHPKLIMFVPFSPGVAWERRQRAAAVRRGEESIQELFAVGCVV